MNAIIERLRNATGQDERLDIAIENAFGLSRFSPPHPFRAHLDGFTRLPATRYTGSIDAALALVERMLPECGYMITRGRFSIDEPMFGVHFYRKDLIVDDAGPEPYCLPCEHNSLPIAILTALFTALQGKNKP